MVDHRGQRTKKHKHKVILLLYWQNYVKYKSNRNHKGGEMLEFIVLGLIPGTNVSISLGSLLLGIAFICGIAQAHRTLQRIARVRQNNEIAPSL